MNTNNDLCMGFRNPTPQELTQIPKWFEVYYKSQIRLVKIIGVIPLVMGLFFLTFLGNDSVIDKISITATVVFFVIVLYCIKVNSDFRQIISEFKKGKFVVMDGKISKIEKNLEYMSCANVQISSANDSCSDKWYKIREEFASVGSSIILVRLNSDKVKKKVEMVFTPFMLTKKGINLQR